ncbi:MAG TPA: MBL fold metallo-hydrolase, partial [Acidimicrobiaceae bacterium]|nr:MBL fold metallo-hydrolase [Acidimicrobiaceae bacterium]
MAADDHHRTITGTGCPSADAGRAGPGVLVDVDGLRLQFDAGRSTVQRPVGAGLPHAEIDAGF